MPDTPSPAPLLSYALSTQPNPLQVGRPSQLVLAVSNGTGARVTCQQIVVTLPVGTNANDLIAAATVTATPPGGWTAQVQGGVIVFVPPGGSLDVEGAGLVFELAVTINDQPGPSQVAVTETAAGRDQPPAARTATLPVAKYPSDFTLSPLLNVPSDKLDIAYGDFAHLFWTATGAGVSCTLTYRATDDGPMVSEQVPDSGPYTTLQKIERSSDAVFTLTARMTVPWQDNPMIAEQQLTLAVDTLSLDFTAEPVSVGVNGLVRLTWDATAAKSCALDAGAPLPATGSIYLILAETRSFSMSATGPHGQSKTVQRTVTVDPTILPTQAALIATGEQGAKGAGDLHEIMFGQPGSRGGDVAFTRSIAPLDTTGRANVIAIQVTGGTGGAGGDGGIRQRPINASYFPAGAGAPGGDAKAVLTIDPAFGPPAQYILDILPGPGGAGGATWPQYHGPPAASGSPGTASLTIDGIPVPLP